MKEGSTFREDLFYRLAVIPLALPPLRERAEDIPDLVQALSQEPAEGRRPELAMSPALLPYVAGYRWPGSSSFRMI